LRLQGVSSTMVIAGPLVEEDFVQPPRAFSASGRPLRLLVVSRLTPTKNVGAVIDAVAKLREVGLPCTLEVLGDGRDRGRLGKRAAVRHVQDRVTFAGSTDDRHLIPGHYARADVLVLPSLTEGASRALMEAMAAGLPVICSNTGGHAELVERAGAGVLLPDPTPEAIAAAVRRLSDDPAAASAMGTRRREAPRQCLQSAWVLIFAAMVQWL